jgi:hypothetical protein
LIFNLTFFPQLTLHKTQQIINLSNYKLVFNSLIVKTNFTKLILSKGKTDIVGVLVTCFVSVTCFLETVGAYCGIYGQESWCTNT